jgi:hypothetical protein
MFCPRCSTTNNPEQKYCRQCGLHLTAVRYVLEGRTNEAMEKLKKGEDAIRGSAVTLGIFILIAFCGCVITPLFDRDYSKWQLVLTFLINFTLGFIFGLPSFWMGLKRLRAARELLDAQQPARLPAPNQVVQLPADIATPVVESPPAAASVTEHTTLNLRSPE